MNHKKGIKAYATFHGKRAKTITPKGFHVPKYLICLGDAVEIVYRCNKENGGGDGTTAEYKHTFARGTKLYMDERCGKLLYISGTRLYVNDRGIVN